MNTYQDEMLKLKSGDTPTSRIKTLLGSDIKGYSLSVNVSNSSNEGHSHHHHISSQQRLSILPPPPLLIRPTPINTQPRDSLTLNAEGKFWSQGEKLGFLQCIIIFIIYM